MLADIYIEALLVNKELADQVWDKGEISDFWAAWAWWLLADVCFENRPATV